MQKKHIITTIKQETAQEFHHLFYSFGFEALGMPVMSRVQNDRSLRRHGIYWYSTEHTLSWRKGALRAAYIQICIGAHICIPLNITEIS